MMLKQLNYKQADDLSAYESRRCVLDLYLPEGVTDFPTAVWMHGGGMVGCDNTCFPELIDILVRNGIAVAAPNYRLSPMVMFPEYYRDTAAAFAWISRHIAEYGGNASKCFLGGHSAGGNLAMLVGTDPAYLGEQGMNPGLIAGLISVSGQMVTHFTIQVERGQPESLVVVDSAAPIQHVRSDLPPVLLLCAENDIPARCEQNQFFRAALQATGHSDVACHCIPGRDHTTIVEWTSRPNDPTAGYIVEFIQSRSR